MSVWLAQSIATQLDCARGWLQRTDCSKNEEWVKLGLYEDSGSCLRIFVNVFEEPGDNYHLRIVQLDPLTLADGAVRLHASLTPACRRALGTPLLYTSFTVHKYILRYTPYGPPKRRITFTLDSVNLHCQPVAGEEPFRHLTPIHSCEEVIQSARRLGHVRAQADRQCFGTVDCKSDFKDAMSPMRSQEAEEGADNGESCIDTQMEYGTQVVHQAQIPRKSAAPGSGRPVQTTTTGSKQKKETELLALLQLNKGRTTAPPPALVQVITTEGAPVKKHLGRSNGALAHAARSSESGAPSAGGFARTSAGQASKDHTAPPIDRMQSTRLPPSYSRETASTKTVISMTTKRAHRDTVPDWLKNTCRTDGCGRVPIAQQKLLASWQKQKDRFPHGNVPIDVFNALKQFKSNTVSGSDNASKQSQTSTDGEDSSIPNALSPEEALPQVAEGSGGCPVPAAHPLADDSDVSSEDESAILTAASPALSWSSSPPNRSPQAWPRPGLDLPPDSSFPDENTPSQSAMQESSPIRSAQRLVMHSSNQEMAPRSSPPPIFDGDDADTDMEMVLPRGLEEGATRNMIIGSPAIPKTSIVHVKETPYQKQKNTGSPSRITAATQVQQQTSSGVSKETSSTSIIYGTYHEPSSSTHGFSRDTDATTSNINALASRIHDHRNTRDSGDIAMEDAETRTTDPQCDSAPSSSEAHGELLPQVEPERPAIQDRMVPVLSLGSSPVSGQRSYSESDSNPVTTLTKRKLGRSSSKQARRPSKRIKYLGFPKAPEDWAGIMERDREASWEEFIQKDRTASLASNLSDGDARPGAQPAMLQKPQQADHEKSQILQNHSVDSRNPSERDGLGAGDEEDPGAGQTPLQTRESLTRESTHDAAATEDLSTSCVPDGTATEGAMQAPDRSEDVDMELVNDSVDDNLKTTSNKGSGVKGVLSNHHVSDEDGSHPQLRLPVLVQHTLAKAVSPATAPKSLHMPSPSKKSMTMFETFKAAYPEYTGGVQHFLGQCKQMEKLEEQDKMVPKWQWDDFIIRNRTDYRDYANRCLDNGEDAEPYYRFYKDNIRETRYTRGIVGSKKALAAAIEELDSGNRGKSATKTSTAGVARIPKTSSTKPARGDSTKTSVKNGAGSGSRQGDMIPIKGTGPGSGSGSSVQRTSRRSLPAAFDVASRTSTSSASKVSKSHTLARRSTPQQTESGPHAAPKQTVDPYIDFVQRQQRSSTRPR